MGKDNKKKKGQSDASAWMDSMMGKNRDIEERYGIEPVSFGGKPGTDQQMQAHADMKSYKDRMVEAFRNDYDARRTLEASAMSGKKKAQDILDSGFKSVSDVRNAQNFFEKAAKRHGQGGQFSNASDFMGLTQSMVERDRRKFTEDIEQQIEDGLAKSNQSEGEATALAKEEVLSDHMQKAKARVDQWEGGNQPVYNPEAMMAQKTGQKSMFADSSRKVYGINEEIDINKVNDPRTEAEVFLDEVKQDVKDEYDFQPVY